jgi:hypothetical protein
VFDINRDKAKVEEIVQSKSEVDKKKSSKKSKDDHDDEDNCVGHALWEDDDNEKKKGSTKLGITMKKALRRQTNKPRGPKKAAHSKMSNLAKHSHVVEKEKRNQKRQKLLEEKDLYKTHHKAKGTSNRKERGAARDRMPHVILSDRLEQVCHHSLFHYFTVLFNLHFKFTSICTDPCAGRIEASIWPFP